MPSAIAMPDDAARESAPEFSPGAQVTVHYDPADPWNSVLETGEEFADFNRFKSYGSLGYGAALILFFLIQYGNS